MQRVTKAAIVLLLALFAFGLGAGTAAADPTPSSPSGAGVGPSSGKNLPKDFPAELKQYVAGTEEFKAGPWFKGGCKDLGGDVGQYIQGSMAQESKLLFWSLSDADREKISKSMAGQNGAWVGKSLFDTFPAGDTSFAPPSGFCADDLKRWASKTTTVWGFDWAEKPDPSSLVLMKKQPNADKVPDERWNRSTACSKANSKDGGQLYCAHSFFLNCEQANQGTDLSRCVEWNVRIGKLFGGTWNWVDKNKSVADRIKETAEQVVTSSPGFQATKAYVDGWVSVYKAGAAIKKFVDNPSNFIDDWANSFKETAVNLTNGILKNLAGVGEFRDLFSPWFVRIYAISEALGLLVMAIMVMLVGKSISGGHIPRRDIIPILFRDMPGSVLAMMIVPVVVQWMLDLSNGLTDVLLKLVQTTTPDLLNNLIEMWYSMDQESLLGGALMAIVCFGMVIIGDILLLVGMLMKVVGVPLLTVAIAIGLGMYVHPRWRRKSLAPMATVTGLIFSTPLLFLGLAIVFNIMNSAALRSSTGTGEIQSLTQICLVAFCMIIMGIAPWTLLKWFPILPTASDAQGPSMSPMGAAGGYGVGRMAGDAMTSARNQATGPSVMPTRGDNGSTGAPGPRGQSGPPGANTGSGLPTYGVDKKSGMLTPQTSAPTGGGARGSAQRSFGSAFNQGAASRIPGQFVKAGAAAAAVGVPMAAAAAKAGARTTAQAAEGGVPRPD